MENRISEQDVRHLEVIRENVERLMAEAADRYVSGPARLLDVAPQDGAGARPFFPPPVQIETLDIDPDSGATHIADLCQTNPALPEASYDFIVCAEVLEHTLQPFAAADEMRRRLKPGGPLFLSVPFNFRIHGPLPDCWRFTEHGLRALFDAWDTLWLDAVQTPERFLMPVHYTLIARKPGGRGEA